MKICILTEGGRGIGYGHITRCLSVYQTLKLQGFSPDFIINADLSINNLLKNTNYILNDWYNSEKTDIAMYSYDIVIIDSYQADISFYEKISKIVKLPVYWDDIKRLNYPRGVIINTAIGAENIEYNRNLEDLILGISYFPLRKVFWESEIKKINKSINSITITFGGDDIRNLTPRVIKYLNKNFPKIKKNVIIGKNFSNIEEVERYSDVNTILIFYPNDEEIKKIMLESDIAISAAGQTLYELARLGIPTIMISVADNQKNNVIGWLNKGTFKYLGNSDSEFLFENLSSLINEFDYDLRNKLSVELQSIVDGKGSKRLINRILEIYKERQND